MRNRRMLACLVFPFTGALALAQGPVMGESVELLDFRVLDAEYSQRLERIVALSSTPSNQLHVYDPASQSGVAIDLPLAGTCVSVGPNGKEAVVGHNGWITHVNLQPLAILDTLAVSTNVGDVVLAGNGYAYCFPSTGQWTKIYAIELATGAETTSTGSSVYDGTLARLHPSGTKIYGANNGLSPSDIERYDIDQGTPHLAYDSPYHGDYAMSGNLWISEDGLRIFVRGGHAFRSADLRSEDMLFNGTLSNLSQVKWLDHSSEVDKVLAIPEQPTSGGLGRDTQLQVYDYKFLGFDRSYEFPDVEVGGKKHPTHGLFVFFEADGRRAWAIVEADPASALLFDHGIVEFQLEPETAPLSTDTDKVSISNGGTQTFSLDAGPSHGGSPYLLLGSINGAVPGIPLGSVVLPLNFDSIYFLYTLAGPNRWPLSNSLGILDSQGRATASFGLAANQVSLSLEGLVLHHAFLVADSMGLPVFSSNAVRLRLIH